MKATTKEAILRLVTAVSNHRFYGDMLLRSQSDLASQEWCKYIKRAERAMAECIDVLGIDADEFEEARTQVLCKVSWE
jgi:hypothetical protein